MTSELFAENQFSLIAIIYHGHNRDPEGDVIELLKIKVKDCCQMSFSFSIERMANDHKSSFVTGAGHSYV